MCEPTTIMLAITAASAVAGLAQQHQTMKAQEDSNQKEHDATLEARNQNLAQVDLQNQQATAQASEKINANNINAAKAMSSTTVQAGENGIGGLSVDSLLAELDGTRGAYNTSVQTNLSSAMAASDNSRQNINAQATSAMNHLQTPQAPDYIGAALKIGSAYYGSKAGAKKGPAE